MCRERPDSRWIDARHCCATCRARDHWFGILLDLARPLALLVCILTLCGLFYTAFLAPANTAEQELWDTLTVFSLAAGICLASGMLFHEGAGAGAILRTLPMQIFLWATGVMAAMFAVSRYLEAYFIFYKDSHRF